MSLIKTKINPQSESYQRNYLLMKEKVIELEQTMQKSLFQGEEKYLERNKKTGKLLARKHIELLLNQPSPFL